MNRKEFTFTIILYCVWALAMIPIANGQAGIGIALMVAALFLWVTNVPIAKPEIKLPLAELVQYVEDRFPDSPDLYDEMSEPIEAYNFDRGVSTCAIAMIQEGHRLGVSHEALLAMFEFAADGLGQPAALPSTDK